MKGAKVVIRLKGGLGNQLFQYAAARGLAASTSARLLLDARTGFTPDRVYERKYALAGLGIPERVAGAFDRAPFAIERARLRLGGARQFICARPWGLYVDEVELRFFPELSERVHGRSVWLDGYWQTERYFDRVAADIVGSLKIPIPREHRIVQLGDELVQENAVAIGVRLYEEAPAGAHAVAPIGYYARAARAIAARLSRPRFYVFSTARSLLEGKLHLPGDIRYVTAEDGVGDPLQSLWLLSRCRNHIISNSSFYWWGAWLAERSAADVKVIAFDGFPNPDTLPTRWTRLGG